MDFPNSTRAKKYFLVLMVGTTSYVPAAKGLNGEDSDEDERTEVKVHGRDAKRRKTSGGGKDTGGGGKKGWILKKKDQMRKRGYAGIPADTKYTGRKRKNIV